MQVRWAIGGERMVRRIGGRPMRAAFVAVAVFAVFALGVPSAAEVQPAHTISVTATGSVDYVPDIATIDVTVRSETTTADAASAAVVQRAKQVLAAIHALGIPDKQVQTSEYRIEYQESFGVFTKPPSYVAHEDIEITRLSLAQVGDVIGAAVQSGAAEVNGPSYDSSRHDELLDEALTKALDAARAEATKIASRSGVELGRLYSLDVANGYEYESSTTAYTTGARVLGRVTVRSSPQIAAGLSQLQVTVHAVYEIK